MRMVKPLESAATDLRVRIAHARDDPGDAGGDDSVRARWRRTLVRTWLQRDVESRALGALAGSLQRDDLCVRRTAPRVPALADDLALGDDYRADERVRVLDLVPPALRQLERLLEAHASACTSRR